MVMSKEYNAKRNREYYKKNKDRINKRNKEHYQETRKERLEYYKIYRQVNKFKRDAQNYAKNNHFKADKCSICVSNKDLEFHHVDYKNYKDKKCGITLCRLCHRKLHRSIMVDIFRIKSLMNL